MTDAVAHGTAAAAHATRVDQSLGVAALAAAYNGDLDAAATLNDRLASTGHSPTIAGFHAYVTAEIAALAAKTDQAEKHYEHAIALARESGATFLDGIASVGLQTIRADAGRTADALDGFCDLIGYWERTGSWIQQWTTLRNLARLLHSLGDEATALFLDAAADHAPDAPARNESDDAAKADAVAPSAAAEIRAQAAAAGRTRVLERAREAIAYHRATTSAQA